MNITEETNDYFSTTEIIKSGGIAIKYPCERLKKYYDSEDDHCNANSVLKDKLKTTPDGGIKKISKIFRVDWSKVFKRGGYYGSDQQY